MFRRAILVSFIIISLLAGALGQELPARSQGISLDERLGTDDGFALALLVTANLRGNLETCDCNLPRGGLARRVGYLKAFKQKFPNAPVLQIEAGQFWYTASNDRHVLLQNDLVTRAYNRWPVDVINLSRNDLAHAERLLAKDGLSERLQRWPLLKNFIAANSNYDDNIAPPAPFIVKEVSSPRLASKRKLRIGFIGLTEAYRTSDGVVDATVKDMYETARRIVPVARKQCDVLVIVAYAEMTGAKRLASENPETDLVIAGNAEGLFNSHQIGHTLVVPTTPGNIQACDIRVYVDKDGHVSFKYLASDLDAAVPSDPEAAAFVQAARLERERARYNQ